METETITTAPVTPPKKANSFLLVICILTFIGSGFGALSSLFSFATADMLSSFNSQYQEQVQSESTPDFFKSFFKAAGESSSPGKIREMALLSLLSNLLTLAGAIMMLKLKKTGFYLYVLGTIIYLIIPFIYKGLLLAIMTIAFNGLIGAAFIAMYAVNLKQMNKPAPESIG